MSSTSNIILRRPLLLVLAAFALSTGLYNLDKASRNLVKFLPYNLIYGDNKQENSFKKKEHCISQAKEEDYSLTNNEQHHHHVFDKLQSTLYQRAIEPPCQDTTTRKEFTLKGWKRGRGGLDDADRMLLGQLYFEANSVFEFGLGESTTIAAHVGVPRYVGVDSDAKWVAAARSNPKILPHFRFSFADIGETISWGHPKNKDLPKIQFDYQIAPLLVETEPFDFYMVDGRYRVACSCVAFLHAMRYGGDMSKVMVGIHDNHRVGRGYHVLKKVADIYKNESRLWVYKLKNSTTEEDLFQMWKKHEKKDT